MGIPGYNNKDTASDNKNPWDKYWESHFRSNAWQKLLYFLRTKVIAKAVRHFTDVYFKDKGIFVEMGSGSSQTSILIQKKLRSLYCLDYAFEPLIHARLVPVIDGGIQGNLLNLPFRRDSVDGIWNLGVMEHFTDSEINAILTEFNRALKPGSYAILFWPPLIGWYKITALILETLLSLAKRKRIQLYPDEINLLRGRKKIQSFCDRNGFVLERCSGIYWDFFTYKVVVIRKA
jgi:SAM-dependent methyltransferase